MKKVLLVRHAKSSWDNTVMKDIDRPLNERGLHDAPAMAKRLLDKGIEIDAFISSTAARAISTCTFFARAYGKEKDIITYRDLYNAPPQVFAKVIKNVSDTFNTIAVFAHNPGITDYANSLTNTRIDDMPTCGIFAVEAATENWKDFEKALKKFWFFDYPKNG
ncbi:MAG TPA: histidine phosphatase family protein [Chitinophagaceae bacterium]|nr:histidine phosphatase family protein [Chitinophagaceae bacterium]